MMALYASGLILSAVASGFILWSHLTEMCLLVHYVSFIIIVSIIIII